MAANLQCRPGGFEKAVVARRSRGSPSRGGDRRALVGTTTTGAKFGRSGETTGQPKGENRALESVSARRIAVAEVVERHLGPEKRQSASYAMSVRRGDRRGRGSSLR